MKGKGEVSETMLNEKEESQRSDNEFQELVMRKLNELTQNYQKLQGNYNERKLCQHEKGNGNYQQGPRGSEEYNF